MRKLFVSLFSGAGGIDQGFVDAGWEPALMVDNWQPAIDTLRANHRNTAVYCWDLANHDAVGNELDSALSRIQSDFHGDSILCVIGGPQCQPFSRLNNNQLFNGGRETRSNLNDPRRSLFMSFLHSVGKIAPPFVVMENVADLRMRKLGGSGSERNRRIIDVILEEFDKTGYNVVYDVLHAQDYNVPQMRRRILFIGVRKDLVIVPSLPSPIPLSTSVVAEFSRICPGHPNQDRKIHTPEWIEKISHIPQGGYYNHLPLEHKVLKPVLKTMLCGVDLSSRTVRVADGYCVRTADGVFCDGKISAEILLLGGQFYKVMPRMGTYLRRIRETVSHTVTRNPLIHPTENREITVREKAAIQTFPPGYEFKGTLQEQRVLVGNAVPCNLGKAIAGHLETLARSI
jgi:DNA (cytosine-5)-methyltransferase 1